MEFKDIVTKLKKYAPSLYVITVFFIGFSICSYAQGFEQSTDKLLCVFYGTLLITLSLRWWDIDIQNDLKQIQ